MIFKRGKTPILAGQIMNTILNIFLLKEHRILLAIDCYYYVDVQVLAASWWKMNSNVVKFLSAVFSGFNVRSTLSIGVSKLKK